MTKLHVFILTVCSYILASITPAAAIDPFVEVRAGPAWLYGNSDTTTGGAAFGGGGVVSNINFDTGYSAGGMIGLQQGITGWYAGISYDYIAADTSFIATFPNLGNQVSAFNGEASSNLLLANIGYVQPLSPTSNLWCLFIEGGAGVAFNSLDNVTEDFNGGDGIPDRALSDGGTQSFAARGSLGLKYLLTDQLSLRLAGNVFTLGDFTTGSSRMLIGGGGVEPIGPYEMDVWGVSVTAGLRFWW